MRIVYISKYVVLPEFGSPTRQYFISKALSKINENKVLLIGSRSTLGNVPKIKGLYQSRKEENLEMATLNGPKIDLGFNVKRLWSWLVFEMRLFQFRRKIKAFKPDIIIVSSLSILTFLSGVLLKKFLKVPLVIEIRDIYPLTLVEIGGYSVYNPIVLFLKWVEKMGYRHADLIMSTLPNVKEHIETVIKKPFNFYWMPMGIDPNYFVEEDILKSISIYEKNKEEFIVGYAGSFGSSNALDMVFEAASSLEKEYPHIKFLFIGEGPLKSTFQAKFKKSGNLIFLPGVSKKDLQKILQNTDLLINTWLNKSIYRFGISPNKWMDYLYAAKPILVSYSGYKCIIDNANCGIFVPAENKEAFTNAVIKFSKMDPPTLSKMGRNGREYLLNNLTYKLLSQNFFEKLQAITTIEKSSS